MKMGNKEFKWCLAKLTKYANSMLQETTLPTKMWLYPKMLANKASNEFYQSASQSCSCFVNTDSYSAQRLGRNFCPSVMDKPTSEVEFGMKIEPHSRKFLITFRKITLKHEYIS